MTALYKLVVESLEFDRDVFEKCTNIFRAVEPSSNIIFQFVNNHVIFYSIRLAFLCFRYVDGYFHTK